MNYTMKKVNEKEKTLDVKKIKRTEYLVCSNCDGEIDGNGECRNYCLPDLDEEHKRDVLAEEDWRQER